MFGTAAGVAYRPDYTEIARRQTSPVGSLTELEVLDALLGLPVGFAVDRAELADHERTLVERATGAVEHYDEQIVRRVVAPMSVRFAVISARDWRVGLRRAGSFAPYCARAMLLPTRPMDWADLQAQASYFGVGVYILASRQLQVLVEPQPYVRKRHTAAQWWFAEEAFRQINARGSG